MNANRWPAMTLGAGLLLICIQTAQAFYNPSTGRWLSRDPANEDAGFNLHGFVGNNPITQADDLGMEFYAVDGTWANARGRSNPWWLSRETTEYPSRYWPGPTDGLAGGDAYQIANTVYNAIQLDFCVAKKCGRELTINMTGWSRGAMVVALVAEMLNVSGVSCPGYGLSWNTYRPVKVNWIGLFDAVAQMPGAAGVFPTAVPSNIAHFDHAVKTKHTGKQKLFPTWHFSGENKREFYNDDGSLTTHEEIGRSVALGNHNNAYRWIRGQAIAAGVAF
jgi:hypothetical protein